MQQNRQDCEPRVLDANARTSAPSLADRPIADADRRRADAAERAAARARRRGLLRGAWQFFVTLSFSSLTRRIVFLNLAGLLALVIGILYLSQFRAGLIDARVQSLLVQGEIIAGAIAASATVETDAITIDPERLLELQTGESYGPSDDALSALEFPINPERVAPVLRRLVSPTNTRARIYDRDGVLMLDSRNLYGRGDVLRFDLPPPPPRSPASSSAPGSPCALARPRRPAALSASSARTNGKGYPEVAQALTGQKASMVRVNDRGEVIVSVAVPVQRFRAVRGALLLSTQGGDIDEMVAGRAACHRQGLPDRGRRHGGAVDPARRHHRRPGAAARRRRRAGAPAHPLARRDSRFHRPPRRDRPSVRHAARHDRRALQPHRGDRELRRRRRARTEEPAHLAALGGRDAAARQDARKAGRGCSPSSSTTCKRLDRLISDISDASRLDAELQRQEAGAGRLSPSC